LPTSKHTDHKATLVMSPLRTGGRERKLHPRARPCQSAHRTN